MSDTLAIEEDWLPSKIYLIDSAPRLIEEWRKAFSLFDEVNVLAGDYFQQPADALVSPANSFGIMDGGLDLAIRDTLGYGVQGHVQQVIIDKYHGELPVGVAEIVATRHADWPYLIAAPTMRIPEPVAFTFNAYFAFRAILIAIKNFNRAAGKRRIDSVVCSGLGTGVGGMSSEKCARQMRLAYKSLLMPAIIGRFESIHQFHAELRMA